MKKFDTPTQVLTTYALAYDAGDVDTLAECFAVDGVFSYSIEGGVEGGPFTGRVAIRESNSAAIDAQRGTGIRRHIITNVLVDTTDTHAHAVSYLVLTLAKDGRLTVVTTGVYDDELVLSDGEWHITRRHLHLDLPF